MNELAECPYCGEEELHTFHYGAETLHCNTCGKEFAIKLETLVVVKSAKVYNKQCCACDTYLHDRDITDGKCPKCGCDVLKNNEYKLSEFDIKQ